MCDDAAALTSVKSYRNDNFATLNDVLDKYLGELREKPSQAVLAVAAPVTRDVVELLNRNWRFSIRGLQARFNMARLEVHNDFFAQALAVTVLSDRQKLRIGPALPSADGTIAVLGPGTGLGVAALLDPFGEPKVITGEGGHMTLAARNETEARIIREARERLGHCSAERFLSGAGLCLLHDILHGEQIRDASSISRAANAGEPRAAATFAQFFRFLGTVAGDVALCFGATGGVYLAGGIAHANQDLLMRSDFRARFIEKGRYRDYLDAIPTTLIDDDMPALHGLAAYAQRWAQ